MKLTWLTIFFSCIFSLTYSQSISSSEAAIPNDSITISNNPFPATYALPSCVGNAPAGNTCATATSICNFSGYCGNTSSAYTINTWPQLTSAFCGSIENNSFISFVALEDSVSLNIWVLNSLDGNGIQMMLYDGGCGTGPVNVYFCNSHIFPSPDPTLIAATGLTPGNTYFIMIDGFAGDVCDYRISALYGINTQFASINYPDSVGCASSAIAMPVVISGTTGGVFTASPAGLSINSNSGNIMPNQSTPGNYTVTYTLNASGNCTQSVSTDAVKIVNAALYVWTGNASSSWEDPRNWSCGQLPTSTSNVILNEGTIVISSNVTIYSLSINPNAVLTVTAGYNLIILH